MSMLHKLAVKSYVKRAVFDNYEKAAKLKNALLTAHTVSTEAKAPAQAIIEARIIELEAKVKRAQVCSRLYQGESHGMLICLSCYVDSGVTVILNVNDTNNSSANTCHFCSECAK